MERFSRTAALVGEEAVRVLQSKHVAVFGVGGVGSHTAEALIRAGIGNLTLVDPDLIEISNFNRQLHALTSTLGRPKVDVMRERLLDINPRATVTACRAAYTAGNGACLGEGDYDYIVDAIDDIRAKVDLLAEARERNIPVVSSMGTGNRLRPWDFEITDISCTRGCPLARAVRRGLKRRGITSGVKVVYSPVSPDRRGLRPPGSISFVPAAAGYFLAAVVVLDLLGLSGGDVERELRMKTEDASGTS